MPNYRCTVFLGEPQFRAGVSETYFCTAASNVTAQALFQPLVVARMAIACSSTTCDGWRVANADSPRDGITFPPLAEWANGTLPQPNYVVRAMDDCLLVRLDTFDYSWFNRKFLRWMPENIWVGTKPILNTGVNDVWFTNWLAFKGLLVNVFKLRAWDPGLTPPDWAYTPILDIVGERRATRRIGRPFALPAGKRRVA